MTQIVPTKEGFEKWLSDIEERESVEDLVSWCREMVSKYPSFQLAVLAVEISVRWNEGGILDVSVVRQVFEQALTACGMDILGSADLWRRYLDFEINEHEEFLEENGQSSNDEALKKSKERFIKVAERQLSLPLVGNEEALSKLEGILEEYCTESDIAIIRPDLLQRKFQVAVAAREERLTFEIYLHGEEYIESDSAAKLQSWLTYIDFEVKAKEFSRAQRLFERALLDVACTTHVGLWLRYALFALCRLKNFQLTDSILQRAKLYHPTCIWIRKFQYIALEGTMSVQDSVVERTQTLLQECISWGFGNTYDYLQIFLAHSNCLRRCFQQKKGVLSLQELQEAFSALQSLFMSYFSQWPEGVALLYKLQSRILLSIATFSESDDRSTSSEIAVVVASWDALSKQVPKHFWVWREAVVVLAQSTKSSATTRATSIFRRCLNEAQQSETAWIDATGQDIAMEWLRFEDDFHDTSALLDALDRCRDFILQAEAAAQVSSNIATTASTTAGTESTASTSRLEGKQQSKDRTKNTGSASASASASVTTTNTSSKPAKRPRPDDEPVSNGHAYSGEESQLQKKPRSVQFSDKLNVVETTERNETGQVTAMDIEENAKSVKTTATVAEVHADVSSSDDQRMKRTLFVSHLPLTVDDAQLRSYLLHTSSADDESEDAEMILETDIADLRVARDKRSGQSKGSALVEMVSVEAAKRVFRWFQKNEISPGKRLSVSFSKFLLQPLTHRNQQTSQISDGAHSSPYGPSSSAASTTDNKPKAPAITTAATITSFRPRTVMKARLNV